MSLKSHFCSNPSITPLPNATKRMPPPGFSVISRKLIYYYKGTPPSSYISSVVGDRTTSSLSSEEISVSHIRSLALHAQTKEVEVGQGKRKFIR